MSLKDSILSLMLEITCETRCHRFPFSQPKMVFAASGAAHKLFLNCAIEVLFCFDQYF